MQSRSLARAAMMARLAVLVGICLTCSGYYSCSFNSGGGVLSGASSSSGGGSGTFTSTLVLRDSSGVESASFSLGEPIRFDFEIRNRTMNTVSVQFDDAQIYDFVVVDAGTSRVRWQWSDGQPFAQVTTEVSFAPDASKSFSVAWDGILPDGSKLPAGSYHARGVMVFDEFAADPLTPSQMGSILESFTVR
jgi:hypothetical protein